MNYVIRSMSTTDYVPGSKEGVTRYHIYLLKPEKRIGAYWSTKRFNGDTQIFDSIEAAQAEIDRSLPCRDEWSPIPDIVPYDDRDVPTYWDARRGEYDPLLQRRVVGGKVVHEERKQRR